MIYCKITVIILIMQILHDFFLQGSFVSCCADLLFTSGTQWWHLSRTFLRKKHRFAITPPGLFYPQFPCKENNTFLRCHLKSIASRAEHAAVSGVSVWERRAHIFCQNRYTKYIYLWDKRGFGFRTVLCFMYERECREWAFLEKRLNK